VLADQALPASIAAVAKAAEGFYSSKGIRTARWRLYHQLKAQGWTVRVNEPVRQADGTWQRLQGPSVTASWPAAVGIELVKSRITRQAIERLLNFKGKRVIVMCWGKRLEPWADTRSEWRRVGLEQLEGIDFIILAGKKPPAVHSQASLALAHEQRQVELARQEAQRQARIKAEQDELAQLIVHLVGQAWQQREPVSIHGNVEQHRHLPSIIEAAHGIDQEATRQAVKRLEHKGLLTRKKHPYTLLSGLALGHKL